MTTMFSAPEADPLSPAAYHARLDEILPLVEARAEAAEAQGHLTDDVVAAMRAAGLYTMLFPKEVGGAELLPIDAMRITERLAYAHGSAAWCVMGGNMEGATMAIYIAQEGIDTVFANGPDITISGNGVPRGYARPVEGGWMIKGNWSYGSGIHHAEWVHSGCFVTDQEGNMQFGENGAPKIIVCHHPRSTIKLLGNWDVLGLKATGSYDYVLDGMEELFLPAHMAYDFDIGAPVRGAAQGALGLAGYSAWAHTGWAIGVGRRMLDELKKVIVNRVDAFGKSSDSASFRFQFAQAEAKFRAAAALAHEAWEDISATYAKGEPHSQEQLTLVKLALRHIHDVASETGTFAYRQGRGAALRNTVMQRTWRDIHAGTQHILMADQMVEECGRGLLGIAPPEAPWTVFGIAG
ncbi:acyl-CoA dehydrogenase family protein [Oceanicella sp. SM1341]|uniref:acyl-CoA dehydrogenase family protein n=1 Tax=Oceanicella sp. SM1341 TaxID=1548889 RepID=UPI0018E58A82|nr:acyl-CoA dehydrogenase family protein [Oceanicella sp. SM1341]